ncbi:MAG: hypothetical protein P8Y70_11705 [Candidatus Lokiarchaeota archaeon]
MTESQLIQKLLILHEMINKIIGYSSVLDTIKKSIDDLIPKEELLNSAEQKVIIKKLKFWEQKLGI